MGFRIIILALLIASIFLSPSRDYGQEAPQPTTVYSIQRENIQQISWSPDGEFLAVSSQERGEIEIIAADNGETSKLLSGIQTNLRSPILMSWSPDSESIASLDDYYHIRIWNVETGTNTEFLAISDFSDREIYNFILSDLEWSPDGTALAAANDMVLNIWNLTDEMQPEFIEIPHAGETAGVSWNPDGSQIAIGARGTLDDTIILLDLSTQEEMRLDSPSISMHPSTSRYTSQFVEWSPDGVYIASFFTRNDEEAHLIFIWDALTKEFVSTLEGHQEQIESIAWNHNGMFLAGTEGNRFAEANPKVRIWSMSNFEEFFVLEGYEDLITSIAWNSHGNQLATVSGGQEIKVWDIPELD